MNRKRIKQACHYGWLHAGQIAKTEQKGFVFRCKVFVDILKCFYEYKMWSNQYVQSGFYKLNQEERRRIGSEFRTKGIERDEWQKDFQENRKFLLKYTSRKYEIGDNREKRRIAYTKRYNAGKDLCVEHNVELSRQHYLNGTIKIGNHVLLAKNVFIDYSGFLEIKDNVKITAGVSMETHHRDIDAYNEGKDINIPTPLVIEEGAYIGTHAIILDSCNYIGKHARIGAGAVVVKDIPDYAVAVGVPAKVVKMLK